MQTERLEEITRRMTAADKTSGSAFVPGFEHDLFISYAVVDDEKEYGVQTGWVTAFMKSLEAQLAKSLGRLGRRLKRTKNLDALMAGLRRDIIHLLSGCTHRLQS